MPREDKKCPTCKGVGRVWSKDIDGPAYTDCDDCDGTGAAKRDNERTQIEHVFGLTGGELNTEGDDWVTKLSPDLGPGDERVWRYWFDGVPEYAESDFDTIKNTYRTVIASSGVPGFFYDEQGKWVREQTFSTSGETECPEKQNEDGDGDEDFVVQGDENCPLCDEKPGQSHGYVYIGEGWQEAVYRLVDTAVMDNFTKMFETIAEAVASGEPMSDEDLQEVHNLWEEVKSKILNNPKDYRKRVKKSLESLEQDLQTWRKRCRSGPFELCVRARTIFAETFHDLAKGLEDAAKKAYASYDDGDEASELPIPAWGRVASEFVTKLKNLQTEIRKQGAASIPDEVKRFRLLEVDEDVGTETSRRRRIAEAANRDKPGWDLTASSSREDIIAYLKDGDLNADFTCREHVTEDEDGEPITCKTCGGTNEISEEDYSLEDAWDELENSVGGVDTGNLVHEGARARGRLLETNPARRRR